MRWDVHLTTLCGWDVHLTILCVALCSLPACNMMPVLSSVLLQVRRPSPFPNLDRTPRRYDRQPGPHHVVHVQGQFSREYAVRRSKCAIGMPDTPPLHATPGMHHPPIHPSIHPCIHPSIDPSIHEKALRYSRVTTRGRWCQECMRLS